LSTPAWNAALAGPAAWPAGCSLLRQGAVPSTIYVIDAGTIKLTHMTRDGDERVVDVRRAPALVGLAFAALGRPSCVEAVTLTPCTLRWGPATAFLSASEQDVARGGELLRLHAAEIASLCDRVVVMSLKTSRQRLRHFMAAHGPSADALQDRATLPYKQSLVASILNVTPEHLSRLLKSMNLQYRRR
jgi:CRP-like cAMP-binding protein